MRRFIFIALALASASVVCHGKLPPLGVKDVSLMLRSGYSAEAIEADLAARHFIGSIDAAGEKALADAGATAALIEKLKSGGFAIPAAELADAQKQIAAEAQRRAAQAEEARKSSTLYQDQVARQRATTSAATAAAANAPGSVVPLLKGDLVTSSNGVLQTFNDQPLEKKKLIALYFSGKWCPNCRKFTPTLVEFYNRVAPAHPEFELIFVSSDRSAAAMEAHMRDAQMPWPAVKFDKIAEKQGVLKYAGNGIPCLVVVDANGRVLSDSYAGEKYLGPSKVLADLEATFGKPPVAQTR